MMSEERSLPALLEQDREMVMAQLGADRSQEAALRVLEKEADRMMYRASMGEDASGEGVPEGAASAMLQVLKNMLPLVGAVSEAEVWEKEGGRGDAAGTGGRRIGIPAIICMIAGAVLVAAGLIAQLAAGWLSLPGVILFAAAGSILLLLGGFLAGRSTSKGTGNRAGRSGRKGTGNQAGRSSGKGSGRRSQREGLEVQQTFLVDPAEIWHILQGTALGIEHSLEQMRTKAEALEHSRQTAPGEGMQKGDLSFFAELLENVYARRRQFPGDESLNEQVENIRYYLHTRGIETEDYARQSASWFEILPADMAIVTIRPAMLQNGIVVMKGMASGR